MADSHVTVHGGRRLIASPRLYRGSHWEGPAPAAATFSEGASVAQGTILLRPRESALSGLEGVVRARRAAETMSAQRRSAEARSRPSREAAKARFCADFGPGPRM